MDAVGESKKRNEEFQKSFDRLKLIRSLVKTESPVLLDIGAHKGESVAYLRKAFPNSFIFSIEPDPDSFQALTDLKAPNHRCLNLAVSNQSGEMSFYKNEISHTNSLFKVNSKSQDSIRIQNAIKNNDTSVFKSFNREIKVRAVTLDDLVDEENMERIDLLKIDVQGAEALVLEGGPKALHKAGAVLLEVSFYDYYEKKTSFHEIEQYLRPAGFELFSISEISQNPMNGRTDWAEVLYTRPGTR